MTAESFSEFNDDLSASAGSIRANRVGFLVHAVRILFSPSFRFFRVDKEILFFLLLDFFYQSKRVISRNQRHTLVFA